MSISTLKNTNQMKATTTMTITRTARTVASQLGNLAFSSAVTNGRTSRKTKKDRRILILTFTAALLRTSSTMIKSATKIALIVFKDLSGLSFIRK